MPLVMKQSAARAARPSRRRATLDIDDPQLRRRAVRALAADPENATRLADRLLVECEPSVRSTIFSALAGMVHPMAVAALRPLLGSADADLRNGAIAAMRLMPSAVEAAIPEILADPDPDIRLFGVNVLQGLAHPRTAGWLIGLIASEEDANIVGAAMEALAELSGPEAVPAVEAAARRFADVPYLRFTCEFACDRMRGLA